MAIYEATTSRSMSESSSWLAKVANLALAAPRQLSVARDPRRYSLPSNEIFVNSNLLQFSASISLWCLGLLLCIKHKPVLESAIQSASLINDNSSELLQSIARAFANACRMFVATAHAGNSDGSETIVKHSGSCQCGSVRFLIKAPKTLYVKDPDLQWQIRYPAAKVRVKSLTLQSGQDSLRSFQQSPTSAAHSFCDACGVHLMHALKPDARYIYVNVHCLDQNTFITRPLSSEPQKRKVMRRRSKETPPATSIVADTNQICTSKLSSVQDSTNPSLNPSSDEFVTVESPDRNSRTLFTVTAASSISKSSFCSSESYLDDSRSTATTTEEYQAAAYRLRRALRKDNVSMNSQTLGENGGAHNDDVSTDSGDNSAVSVNLVPARKTTEMSAIGTATKDKRYWAVPVKLLDEKANHDSAVSELEKGGTNEKLRRLIQKHS